MKGRGGRICVLDKRSKILCERERGTHLCDILKKKKAKPIASIYYRKKDFLTPMDILYMTIRKLLGREHLIIIMKYMVDGIMAIALLVGKKIDLMACLDGGGRRGSRVVLAKNKLILY